MAAVGFEPMALGFLRLVGPTHCAINVDPQTNGQVIIEAWEELWPQFSCFISVVVNK